MIFSFILFLPICIWSHSLIFVHLGEDLPRCIFTTMKQARFFNPDCDVYLLTNQSAYTLFNKTHSQFFETEKVCLINMDLVPLTIEHRDFHEVNKIGRSLSGGFWSYATERFFILLDFIKERGLENVVHLESDTMLYISLDELLDLFWISNCHLAAPFQSKVGCIPCFVYIKDSSSLEVLIHHILSEMRSYSGKNPHIYINDMQTLASFHRKFGSDFMIPLPTLMPEYSHYHRKKKSRFGPDNGTPLSFLSLYASSFPGYIFDAAGLGIWINGNDRRYSPSHGPGTIHSRLLFDPGFFSFYWNKDSQGRNIPYLSFKGKNFRIINLHFHSKMPEDYTSFDETHHDFFVRSY